MKSLDLGGNGKPAGLALTGGGAFGDSGSGGFYPPGAGPTGPADPGSPFGAGPPGGYNQQPYSPPPIVPAPGPKGTSTCLILGLGCLVVIVVLVIISAGSCYYIGKKATEAGQQGGLFVKVMMLAKPSYTEKLSSDHSQEQRERFEKCYIDLINKEAELGFSKWIEEYGEVFSELTNASGGSEITVEQSQTWCDHVEKALANDETGGPEPASGDTAQVKPDDTQEPQSGDTAQPKKPKPSRRRRR